MTNSKKGLHLHNCHFVRMTICIFVILGVLWLTNNSVGQWDFADYPNYLKWILYGLLGVASLSLFIDTIKCLTPAYD